MSKKIIRGFRTNMALYGLCLIVFVIVTIPFEPVSYTHLTLPTSDLV